MDDLDALGDRLAELDEAMGGADAVAARFGAELANLRRTMTETGQASRQMGHGIETGLRRALDGVVSDGLRLSDALRTVGRSIVDGAYRSATAPVVDAVGSAALRLPIVAAFARGGVVSEATAFPLNGGLGVMGEAGPEAVLPLSRGADGRLGVASQAGAASVTINITTPDVEGFRRSRSQITAELSRALTRGQRNA